MKRVLAALALLVLAVAPAGAVNLLQRQVQTYSTQTSKTMPGATVTIYNYGTLVKATIYDPVTNAPISNPMTADSNGMVAFQIDASNKYQAVWASGIYTSPAVLVQNDIASLPSSVWIDTSNAANISYSAGFAGASPVSVSQWMDTRLVATTAFGLDPTGVSDSTWGLRAVHAAAAASGKTAWYPCGTYRATTTTGTVTMTIAAPGVVTWTNHRLPANSPVRFTTSGSLPSYSATITSVTTNGTPGSNNGTYIYFASSQTFDVGTSVTVSGMNPSGYNGTYTVTGSGPGGFRVAGSFNTALVSGGTATGAMVAGRNYYVTSTGLGANTFSLSTKPLGSPMTTTGSQSGTHTAKLPYIVYVGGGSKLNFDADAYNCAKIETSGVDSTTDIWLQQPTSQVVDQRMRAVGVTGGGGASVYHLDTTYETTGPVFDTIIENLDWYDTARAAPNILIETIGDETACAGITDVTQYCPHVTPRTPGGVFAYSTIRNVNMQSMKCTLCGDGLVLDNNVTTPETKTATITNVVGSGSTVTVTAANTFSAGDTVILTGVSPSNYNIAYSIATASPTQFTASSAQTGAYVSGGTAWVTKPATVLAFEMDFVAGAASPFFTKNIIANPKAFKFHSGAAIDISGNELESSAPNTLSWDAVIDFAGDYNTIYGATVRGNSIVTLAQSNAGTDLIYADKIDSLIIANNPNLSLYQHGGYHLRATANTNANSLPPFFGADNRATTVVGYPGQRWITVPSSTYKVGCAALASGSTANTVLHGTSGGDCGVFSAVAVGDLASQAANTIIANVSGSSAVPTAYAMPTCSATTAALNYLGGTGFTCNTTINAATLGGATFASPGAIGGTTPAAGTFTTLKGNYIASTGTVPTGNTGTCTASSFVGGATAGKFSAAVCTAGNTFILSGLPAQTNGYACDATDMTTSSAKLRQTAYTTTSATLTVDVATVAADAVVYKCIGF